MFIDEVEITLKAGSGGNGKVSFFPGKKSGPDGGNGGNGGNLFVKATKHLSNLNQFIAKQTISAENGKPGQSNNKTGASGKDLILEVPIGSLLLNQENSEKTEVEEEAVLICKGGKGGKGNAYFKSASNTTPISAEKGEPGQEKRVKIILRLIADFGLIGLPNTGKSSLLNKLTNAKAKVANYPFTTLQPNLGVTGSKVFADIPGLIEGASAGKGLGISFLKHIDKVSLILHCISTESENPLTDYKIVMEELEKFNPDLIKKPQIILLTKSDLLDLNDLSKKVAMLKKLKTSVLPISIYNPASLNKLVKNLVP